MNRGRSVRLALILVGTLSSSVSVQTLTRAEFSRDYDRFSDRTTVQVAPVFSQWDRKPTLFLSDSFPGQSPDQEPSLLFFSVIAPIEKYSECATGITGVIADGQRVKPLDERNPMFGGLGLPKIEPLRRTNPKLSRYILLSERYQVEDFQRIVNASEVVYQLCTEESETYRLTAQEKDDLKKYFESIIPRK